MARVVYYDGFHGGTRPVEIPGKSIKVVSFYPERETHVAQFMIATAARDLHIVQIAVMGEVVVRDVDIALYRGFTGSSLEEAVAAIREILPQSDYTLEQAEQLAYRLCRHEGVPVRWPAVLVGNTVSVTFRNDSDVPARVSLQLSGRVVTSKVP